MSFQNVVLVIAVILLILCLIIFGVSLYNKKYHEVFPPVQSTCPDYWVEETNSANEKICVNDKGLGNSDCQSRMDFSNPPFTGSKSKILCAKEQWAKKCGLTWDGVTNNPDACSSKN